MKVFVNGRIKEKGRVEKLMIEIINNMSKKIGVPEGTEIAVEGLEFKVRFNIDGQATYATVPREVAGETVNEIFMVSVHLDKEGNILQSEDNEEESFHDGYTLAKAVGKDYVYTGTESNYRNDELEVLEYIGDNTSNDVMAVRYKVIAEAEVEVVRHYKGDLLVAEYEYRPKENMDQ